MAQHGKKRSNERWSMVISEGIQISNIKKYSQGRLTVPAVYADTLMATVDCDMRFTMFRKNRITKLTLQLLYFQKKELTPVAG